MKPHFDQPPPSSTDVLPRRRVPLVLMYHRVGAVTHDPHSLAVSPRRLRHQLAWLKRRRLRGVAIGELVDAMCSGTDKGLVGITFDDGYADLLDEVPTVLQHYGFSATVFVVTRRLGSVNDWDLDTPWQLLDADGVRMVAEAGLEIASHGRTHISLAGIDPAALRDETYGSRTDLDRLLGAPVRGFAYPYGSVDGPSGRCTRSRLHIRLRCLRSPPGPKPARATPHFCGGGGRQGPTRCKTIAFPLAR